MRRSLKKSTAVGFDHLIGALLEKLPSEERYKLACSSRPNDSLIAKLKNLGDLDVEEFRALMERLSKNVPILKVLQATLDIHQDASAGDLYRILQRCINRLQITLLLLTPENYPGDDRRKAQALQRLSIRKAR